MKAFYVVPVLFIKHGAQPWSLASCSYLSLTCPSPLSYFYTMKLDPIEFFLVFLMSSFDSTFLLQPSYFKIWLHLFHSYWQYFKTSSSWTVLTACSNLLCEIWPIVFHSYDEVSKLRIVSYITSHIESEPYPPKKCFIVLRKYINFAYIFSHKSDSRIDIVS